MSLRHTLPASLLGLCLLISSVTATAGIKPDNLAPWLASEPFPAVDKQALMKNLGDSAFSSLEKQFSDYRKDAKRNPDREDTMYQAFQTFSDLPKSAWKEKFDAWIDAYPESANAYIARAHFLEGMAWDARGGDYASNTPEENFRVMHAIHEEAIRDARSGLALDPSHPMAYRVLLRITRHQGVSNTYGIASEALQACPESYSLWNNLIYLRSSYKWSHGSPEEGFWIAQQAQQHVKKNPRLRALLAIPFVVMAERAYDQEEYEAAFELLTHALAFGDDESALALQKNTALALKRSEEARQYAIRYFTYFPNRSAANGETLDEFLAKIENAEREKFKNQGYWE